MDKLQEVLHATLREERFTPSTRFDELARIARKRSGRRLALLSGVGAIASVALIAMVVSTVGAVVADNPSIRPDLTASSSEAPGAEPSTEAVRVTTRNLRYEQGNAPEVPSAKWDASTSTVTFSNSFATASCGIDGTARISEEGLYLSLTTRELDLSSPVTDGACLNLSYVTVVEISGVAASPDTLYASIDGEDMPAIKISN